MEVIKISATAILPLMAFMALGYYFKKKEYLNPVSTKQLNIICFRFFLSVMCGETIYKANLKEDVHVLTVVIVAAGILLTFIISSLIVPRFVKDRTRIPVMIQAIYKTNYAVLGIPLAQSICGEANIGIISVIAVVLVPLNNGLSAYVFEKYTGKSSSVPKTIWKIVTNPLVLGSLIGLALNLSGLKIPQWIMTGIVSKLSIITTPLILIALGATFEFGYIEKYRKELFWAIMGRLIISPAIIVPVSILLGLRGPALVGIIVYSAAPTAVNSYSTAVAMGGDADLANEIVIMTSILSMLTMFLCFTAVGLTVGF